MCNICFDNFHSTGPHRIVALKCGHIFGQSCINTWVKEQKNCPQCKSKTTNRDFRPIFASKIQVADNAREMELEMQIQRIERERNELAVTNLQNSTTIALQRRQIKELQEEIKRLTNLTLMRKNSGTSCIQVIKGGRMFLEKNVDFRENSECRLINFMQRNKKILISQKAVGTTLFSGYGLRFLDAVTHRCEKFINTSMKTIDDFTFDNTESLIMSASKESTCKIYNISSCQSVASISNPDNVPIWCCSFGIRDHQVVLGAQNGSAIIYDTRRSTEVLQTLTSLNNKSPVKYIIVMKSNEAFPFGGFFVIQLRGIYFYEYTSNMELAQTKLNFDFSIFTASYDEKTEMLLISSVTIEQSFRVLMRLIKEDGIPMLQEVYKFHSNQMSNSIPVFTRPAQIKVPDGFIVATYADQSKELQTYTPSIGRFHSINMQNVISDICPIYNDNSISFAALSSTKCRVYKVNLEYR